MADDEKFEEKMLCGYLFEGREFETEGAATLEALAPKAVAY